MTLPPLLLYCRYVCSLNFESPVTEALSQARFAEHAGVRLTPPLYGSRCTAYCLYTSQPRSSGWSSLCMAICRTTAASVTTQPMQVTAAVCCACRIR